MLNANPLQGVMKKKRQKSFETLSPPRITFVRGNSDRVPEFQLHCAHPFM